MSFQKIDSRQKWCSPPRPEWVERINREGDVMDIANIVPLDENSLISAAKSNTGLSDFGDDAWYEPFKVYLKSLEHEANLNLVGRLLTRSDILNLLQARLRIEENYKKFPEIDKQTIENPLIIMGQGRTGTSFLFQVLAEDPRFGVPKTWEAMFPCPPPEKETYLTDPRISKADKLITQWQRIAPSLNSMHEFSGEIPTECLQILALNFTSSWLNIYGQVPSYNAYLETVDWKSAFEYHKRVLKLLQWKNPRERWVLKTPEYIQYMPQALEVYPEAGFIWTHRDPVKVMGSIVNLVGTLHWIRTDTPFIHGAFDKFTQADRAAEMLENAIDWLEEGVVNKNRVCNVQYQHFVKDPLKIVKDIYEYFNIEISQNELEVVKQYIESSNRSNRPAHSYEVGSKESVLRTRKLFQRYESYFNVLREC